jgi:hypothetical protein
LALALGLASGAQARNNWQVRVDGVGPFKVGVHYENLEKTFRGQLVREPSASKQCFVARLTNAPGVRLTFVKGTMQRIDITGGGIVSDRGVHVGDPLSKLTRVYGDAVKETPPWPSDAGQYHTVTAGGGQFAIRYLANGGRVAAIQAGTWTPEGPIPNCP